MHCTNCGTERKGDYCYNCGQKTSLVCLACGAVSPYSINFKFCFDCGENYDSTQPNMKVNDFQTRMKTESRDSYYQKYKNIAEMIVKYVTDNKRWVSYDELAKHIGLKNFTILVDKDDPLSTLGHIVNRFKLRSKNQLDCILFKMATPTYKRDLRYLKLKSVEIPDPDNSKACNDISMVFPAMSGCEVIFSRRVE
mgnify:CR=1 FL=1